MLKKAAAAFALVGLMAGAAYSAGGPATGVVGSMHDMNVFAGSQKDALGRACVFCHTPHNANQVMQAPLWNRSDTAPASMAPYAWISPANLAGTYANILDPLIGPSRLCMSCHDGITNVDSHNTVATQAGAVKITSTTRSITDLSAATHPIGFSYEDAAALRGPTEIVPSTTGFITSDVTATFDTNTRTGVTYTNKKISDVLYGKNLTCASCHDVHNTVNAKPDAGHTYNYFLYAKEEGSAICLSCHVK